MSQYAKQPAIKFSGKRDDYTKFVHYFRAYAHQVGVPYAFTKPTPAPSAPSDASTTPVQPGNGASVLTPPTAEYIELNEKLYALLVPCMAKGAAELCVMRHSDTNDGFAAWQDLRSIYDEGTTPAVMMRLYQQFNKIKQEPEESVEDFIMRVQDIAGKLAAHGDVQSDARIITTVLQHLLPEFRQTVLLINMQMLTCNMTIEQIGHTLRNTTQLLASLDSARSSATAAAYPATAASPPKYARAVPGPRPPGHTGVWCCLHGHGGHSDADCRTQRYREQQLRQASAHVATQELPRRQPLQPQQQQQQRRQQQQHPQRQHQPQQQQQQPQYHLSPSPFALDESDGGVAFMARCIDPPADLPLSAIIFGATAAADGFPVTAILDSGASRHMVDPATIPNSISCVADERPCRIRVRVGGGIIYATSICTVHAQAVTTAGIVTAVRLDNTLLVPGLGANLVSMASVVKRNAAVTLAADGASVTCGSRIFAVHARNGVYVLQLLLGGASNGASALAMPAAPCPTSGGTTPSPPTVPLSSDMAVAPSPFYSDDAAPPPLAALPPGVDDVARWHRRLAHPSADVMGQLRRTPGTVTFTGPTSSLSCGVCPLGKSTHLPYPGAAATRSGELLGLVHVDAAGPINPPSLRGAAYAVGFTDDKSRRTVVYALTSKDGFLDSFAKFVAAVAVPDGLHVRRVRLDNAGEYISAEFRAYCDGAGIQIEHTAPHAHSQVGVAERKWRTLFNAVRCMLHDAGLPKALWMEALQWATHVNNRLPSNALDGLSPLQVWTGTVPSLAHVHVWGCWAFVHVEKHARDGKIGARAWRGRLVGCDLRSLAWRVYNETTNSVQVSRHVTFIEAPELIVPSPAAPTAPPRARTPAAVRTVTRPPLIGATRVGAATLAPAARAVGAPTSRHGMRTRAANGAAPYRPVPAVAAHGAAAAAAHGDTPNTDGAAAAAAHGHTPTIVVASDDVGAFIAALPFLDMQDYVAALSIESPDFNYDNDIAYVAVDAPASTISYSQAMRSADAPQWRAAVAKEMASLDRHGVFTVVPLPPGRRALAGMWVMRVKRDAASAVTLHKARFVAKGCAQVPGVDFTETFAPTAQLASLRVLLALAAQHGWVLHQLDVQTALLHSPIDEELYVNTPQGYVQRAADGTPLVLRLHKSLYGLRQAPRLWHATLAAQLGRLGFACTDADPSVFVSTRTGVIALVYVDDIVITGTRDRGLVDSTIAGISAAFAITDIGCVAWCLGIAVARDIKAGTIIISQQQYVADLLQQHHMELCNSVSTPSPIRRSSLPDVSIPLVGDASRRSKGLSAACCGSHAARGQTLRTPSRASAAASARPPQPTLPTPSTSCATCAAPLTAASRTRDRQRLRSSATLTRRTLTATSVARPAGTFSCSQAAPSLGAPSCSRSWRCQPRRRSTLSCQPRRKRPSTCGACSPTCGSCASSPAPPSSLRTT